MKNYARLVALLNLAVVLNLAGCASQEFIEYCKQYNCVDPIEEQSPFMMPRMKATGWIIREEF